MTNFDWPQPLAWLASAGLVALRLNPLASAPSDALGGQVAHQLQTLKPLRDRLTAGIYQPSDPTEALGRLDHAYDLAHQAEALMQRIKAAVKTGHLPSRSPETLETLAYEADFISQAELDLLVAAKAAGNQAIQVDSFTLAEYQRQSTAPAAPTEPHPARSPLA